MKVIILIIINIFTIYPCQKLTRGVFWSHDELIDSSKTIVLAELLKFKSDKQYILKVIEAIKGKANSKYVVLCSNCERKNSNDFSLHTDSIFWKTDIGRNIKYPGECKPNHTFEPNKRYLLFPDAFGSNKSAELILNERDQWLQYVIRRVSGKDTTLSDYKISTNNLGGLWKLYDTVPNIKGEDEKYVFFENNYITSIIRNKNGTLEKQKNMFIISYGKMIIPNRLQKYLLKISADTLFIQESDELDVRGKEYRYRRIKNDILFNE